MSGSVLYLHDVDGAGATRVDGLEHARERVGVVILLLYEFDRDCASGEFGWEDRLHAMRHVALLVEKLFDGVGDGGGLNVAVSVEHGGRIGGVLGGGLWRVCVDDMGDGEKTWSRRWRWQPRCVFGSTTESGSISMTS